jgi:hypothetical protein
MTQADREAIVNALMPLIRNLCDVELAPVLERLEALEQSLVSTLKMSGQQHSEASERR